MFTVQADLTKSEEVEAAKRQIIERFGTVNILNAALAVLEAILKLRYSISTAAPMISITFMSSMAAFFPQILELTQR